jgi:3-oxoadipate enol-lactonase
MRACEIAGMYAEEDGSGEPVLLLHAGVTDRRVWDLAVPVLVRAGYRAVRYDGRGYGRSARPTEPYSLVADALAVLDGLDLPAAHWVGLSGGAATAVDAALASPERVRTLTLVAPGVSGFTWPSLPAFARLRAAYQAGDAALVGEETLRVWGPLSFDEHDRPVDELAARVVLDQVDWFFQPQLAIEEPSPLDRLGAITAPTLVVLGDRDVDVINDIGRLLAAGIPGARQVTLTDADHLLPLRVPDQFHPLLLEHLR